MRVDRGVSIGSKSPARERVSLRGIERISGMCHQTVAKWICQHIWTLSALEETLSLYEVGNVLEVDELGGVICAQ